MLRQNLHTHTIFDDGSHSPFQMAEAALESGLTSLGFSVHSVLPYENDWSIKPERISDYLSAVSQVRDEFADRLAIYSGLEWDVTSSQPTEGFDYIIGSVHHVAPGREDYSIDWSVKTTREILANLFHGDRNAMLQAYFSQFDVIAADSSIDIVGHFDLISKFDDAGNLFDGNDPVYRDLAITALETLLQSEKIFEVNTGAMSRGYRTVPYPAPFYLRELKARRGRVLVSSDAHETGAVAYAFREMEDLLKFIGFQETWQFGPEGFFPVKL